MNTDINHQLFDAVCNNNLTTVQQLISNGADVNYLNEYGEAPLHYVRSVEIAHLLVLNGANVNCLNEFCETPLMYCATDINEDENNNLEYAKILLKNGADMHIKNIFGSSAYLYAKLSDNNKLIELFEQYNPISNGFDIKEPCIE